MNIGLMGMDNVGGIDYGNGRGWGRVSNGEKDGTTAMEQQYI